MRAVILAGGLGMRLRPYTTILPKPLVPVGDRPILEHILRRLAACGVTEVDLCVSHLGELIQTYFSQSRTVPEGLELRWHWEDEPLGTAGALNVIPDLEGTFIVMNGDVLTTIDYRELVAHHQASGAALTVSMHTKEVNIDLGVITLPVQVMQSAPYILTVIILAGFVGRAIPPRAGGEPYVKER